MNFFWSTIARFFARPDVVDWLIRRAKRTPYTHITGPDGSVYMERYWLFNPYQPHSDGRRPWWQFPIAIRLHRIMRKDGDRDLHDHPWNARTIILRGWYEEVRLGKQTPHGHMKYWPMRVAGDTACLRYGEYHQITEVSDDGVWTMFITGRHQGTWGFLVDGVKVPWRQYLGLEPKS